VAHTTFGIGDDLHFRFEDAGSGGGRGTIYGVILGFRVSRLRFIEGKARRNGRKAGWE
jgi:hypothetical protein